MSKALELAARLELMLHDWIVANDAAAELRRLDAEVKTLKELTETMRKTFEGRIVDAQIVVDKALLENKTLRDLLKRYRNETPLGHQPHMIAHEVDATLKGSDYEPD